MSKNKNQFLIPTVLYKEFVTLDLIEYNPNVTQRDIAKYVNSSVSMINAYLNTLEEEGYIIKEYVSKKIINYKITKKGIERKRVLNIGYLNDIHKRYQDAKKDTISFINMIVDKGFKNIIFYGAGEVSEILLQTINDDRSIPVNVVGVVDDDPSKVGSLIANHLISDNSFIVNTNHDAIVIASYTQKDNILDKLIKMNYKKENILYFFQ